MSTIDQSDQHLLKERESTLEWVPISSMRVSPVAQRKYRSGWASEIAADFNPDKMGIPVVSFDEENGVYWIQDGQHRIGAMKILGWDDQKVQCEVYRDLTESERAELFLARNHVKSVNRLDKFKVSVTATHAMECDIVRIAERLDLSVGSGQGRIGSVAALEHVYTSAGPEGLHLVLKVIRDAYGTRAFEAGVIRGIGLLIQRHGPKIDVDRLVRALADRYGGFNALMNEAEIIQRKRRHKRTPKPAAIAEAAASFYNEVARAGRLREWSDEEQTA